MMRSPNELAAHFRYANEDATGRLHVDAGSPQGGQFTGKAEHGQSPDDMANKLASGQVQQPQGDEANDEVHIATGKENAIREIMAHQADYGDDDPDMDENLMNEILVNADVNQADRQKILDNLYDDGFLVGGDNEPYMPGPTMKALRHLQEFAAENPDDALDLRMIANLTGESEQEAQATADVLFNNGYLDADNSGENFKIIKALFQKSGRKHRYANAERKENRMKTPDELAAHFKHGAGGKVEKTMREFKAGELHSGSKTGPEVTNRKQAIAIGLSEARKEGEKVPPPK